MRNHLLPALALASLVLLNRCALCPFPNTTVTAQQAFSYKVEEKLKKNREIFLGDYLMGQRAIFDNQSAFFQGTYQPPTGARAKGFTLTVRWQISGLERVLGDSVDVKVKKDGSIPEVIIPYPIEAIEAGESAALWVTPRKKVPEGGLFRVFYGLKHTYDSG